MLMRPERLPMSSVAVPPPAIHAVGLSKVYDRDSHDTRSLKELLTFKRRRVTHEPLVALHDVTFDVRPGEAVGVIGTNGAGKSTLLRLVAGITPPTSGHVARRGRIGSLLELGAGFQPDLSGHENIYLTASMMGVPREEAEEALDDIIDFAELRPFIHTPVKHYSSGMYVRLGFSAAVHLAPELLLLDEVLSVGDARFQVLSFRRLFELRERGVASVLVSHDLHALESLCDRLLWLHRGRVHDWGPTEEVMRRYRVFLQGKVTLPEIQSAEGHSLFTMPEGRIGSGEIIVSEVRILGPDGHATQTLMPEQPMTIELDTVASADLDDVDVMLTFEHESLKAAMISGRAHGFAPRYAKGRATVRVHFEQCLLNVGSYQMTVALVSCHDLTRFYDHHVRLHRFAVATPAPAGYSPLLRLPIEFHLSAGSAT